MMKLYHWMVFAIIGILVPKEVQCQDVDGGWSPWSVFNSPCSKSCEGGTQTSLRSCSLPEPEGNGKLCPKTDGTLAKFEKQIVSCNTQSCFFGMFSNWIQCDDCTIGVRYRISICDYGSCYKNDSNYVREEEKCNRWNKTHCPSPCLTATCPQYGVCKDISTDDEIKLKCICTQDRQMNEDGSSCVRPPPEIPTPKPIPTLPPAQKTVATVMSKTASVVLIAFVGVTLGLFLILRIFTPDRVIQMNMEIALILAHVFLMFPPSTVDTPFLCKLISILIHFCFTACYMFIMLEALHMYFLVGYVVKKDGAFSRLQNTLIGWGIAAIVILLTICFQYENYGGKYHCWLQMDTPLAEATFVPVIIIVVVTFTLIEAAGAINNKPVAEYNRKQRLSAKISQRTNLIILPFVLAHWIIGMMSEYQQNLPLYGTFSVLNGITGFLVFFFHSTNNQKVREKLKKAYKKMGSSSSL